MTSALAAALAQAARELPPQHRGAWADTLRSCPTPSTATEERLLASSPYEPRVAVARQLVRAWHDEQPDLSGEAMALALETAAATHEQTSRDCQVDLAVTGPSSDAVPLRFTSEVVIETIRAARWHLLLVSFAAYNVSDVVNELRDAAERDVGIDIVLESTREGGGTLAHNAMTTFSDLSGNVTFWHWPAEHRPLVGTSRAALHAKLLIADTHTALLGSANLTRHALTHNLEVGAVIRGRPVVSRLTDHFAALMNPTTGPLEQLT